MRGGWRFGPTNMTECSIPLACKGRSCEITCAFEIQKKEKKELEKELEKEWHRVVDGIGMSF